MAISWTEGLVRTGEDETLEQLSPGGAAILQKKLGFRFGTDAVALASFASEHLRHSNGRRGTESMIDLGTGTGIIALLMALLTQIPHIRALEIQADMADMALRTVAGNRLENRITVLCADLRQADRILGRGCHDLVLCNPPYQPVGAALQNDLDSMSAARHEIHCTLSDVVGMAALLLRPAGAFCMVHRPERLPELFEVMKRSGMEPKQLQMVHRSAEKPPSLVLLRGLKGGRPGLHVLAPRLAVPVVQPAKDG
jgi:tRNA1Val (adenine37-N6)-methyltransferase